jgi:hypothetical protein
MLCRIGAEGRQQHRLAGLALGLGHAGLPELVERRDGDAGLGRFCARQFVEMF